jgi:citrate synthase
MTLMSDIGLYPSSSHVSRVVISTDLDFFVAVAYGLLTGFGKLHASACHLCAEMIQGLKSEEEAKLFAKLLIL